MARFDPDLLSVVGGVLGSLFWRMTLFAATIFFGGYIGLHVPNAIPAGYAHFLFVAALLALLAISFIAIAMLVATESNGIACQGPRYELLGMVLGGNGPDSLACHRLRTPRHDPIAPSPKGKVGARPTRCSSVVA